jgi:chemotaxis protein CheD
VIHTRTAEPYAPAESFVRLIPTARRFVVGIGEFAVSNDRQSQIVTHALGSCVAICLWDPVAGVAGLMHVLLPDSLINPDRARRQPAAFADTGIPLLLRTAYEYGIDKTRCVVRLVGGADVMGIATGIEGSIGRCNVLAIRNLLSQNGVLVQRSAVGGVRARTVTMSVGDGRVQISTAGEAIVVL